MKRKNRIRLSEAQLHNIIRESVKQVIRKTRLNEIGNTDDGAKALGALSQRNDYHNGFHSPIQRQKSPEHRSP